MLVRMPLHVVLVLCANLCGVLFFVKELEDEEATKGSFISEEEEKLVNTKKAMHAKCKQLTQKCHTQEREIERLKSKLQKMADEVQ